MLNVPPISRDTLVHHCSEKNFLGIMLLDLTLYIRILYIALYIILQTQSAT